MGSSLKRWTQVGQGEFMKWTEKEQTVEGIWEGQHDGQFGPLGTVTTSEGRVSFPLHMALLNKVEQLRKGAEIKIVYLGKQANKEGTRQYKNFAVFVADPQQDLIDPDHTFPPPERDTPAADSDDVPF